MAVEVQVISSKFYKQWNNDDDYSVDVTNYCNNLAGLVMQKIKVVEQIKIQWSSRMLAAQNEADNMQWSVAQPTTSTMTIDRYDGGSFLTDGFSNDDTVRISACQETTGTWQNYTDGVVSELTAVHMKITFSAPVAALNTNIFWYFINGMTPLTSLVYNYGLIENNENWNDLSKVNNESQGWYSLAEIGEDSSGSRDTNPVSMEGLGVSNAWENGSATVAYVADEDGFTLYWQIFEIVHIFIIPYFSFGDLTDFENDVLPAYLAGGNSLKYAFNADFRTVLSNPNTSKKAKVTNILGSVGWYNENFNGFDSNYNLVSVNYTDPLLGTASGLLIGATTMVTVVIEKLVGNFNTGDRVGVYFSYLPELQSEVENTITNFETNFIYDNIFCEVNGLANGGAGVLDDCQAFVTCPTNLLEITFITDFTAAQQVKLSNLKSYVLGFEVGDITIDAGLSDVVILKELNQFDDSADIPDLMTLTNKIYPYSFPTSGVGYDDFEGWNEHGLAFKIRFVLDLTKSAFINSFEALLVAYKSSDGTYFELDKYTFQIDSTLVTVGANTYQELHLDTTRGYPLVTGSEKNLVKITIDQSTLTGTSPAYDVEFSQKIRWEDWIKNFDADTIFTNYSEQQNNLNFKSSNYSFLLGYKIRMLFKFNVAGVSYLGVAANTDYLFFTPNFTIHDYDVDGMTPVRFTQVIETFNLAGVSLGTGINAMVQVGVDTVMKITWTYYVPPIVDITGWWAIHRIEENGELGQQLFELGTVDASPTSGNYLKGVTTNFVDMAIVGGNVVTTCLIDGTQIVAGRKYNLSGEIYSSIRK